MNIKIQTTKEEFISYIDIILPVRYGEEEIPNDFPFRKGDSWSAMIEVDTGKICNWPKGKSANMHLTVKDGGSYKLISPTGKVIASIKGNYVPHGIVPGSYGDTVELSIDGDGTITNWPKNPDASDFFKDQS